MQKNGLSSSWKVVAAGFLCMTVAAGIGWYVFPVYLTSIESALGANRTQMSLAVTVWAFVGGAFSPFVGRWIDKYGARKVMTAGTICQIVTTVLLGRMTSLWQLYALFILASLASVANTTLPVSAIVARWFDKSRGTVMGIALLGMGLGGFIMPKLAGFFLSHSGWRGGYLYFALILAALLIPITLWVREKPAGTNTLQAGEARTAADVNTFGESLIYKSLSVAESARTRSFWTLSIGDFLIGLVFTTVIVHMVAFSTDAGFSMASATTAYGAFNICNALGILTFGAASDKIKIRRMMVFCYSVPAFSMFLLFGLHSLWPLYIFAVIFGVTGGGRSALWPLALGESFGVGEMGAILGWLNIPFMTGNAIGPYFAGYIYDVAGSYQNVFLLCIGISLFAGFFISLMRNERPRINEQLGIQPDRSTA